MKVLVLCTGNSARSILLEAILSARAQGRIETHSAGSHPAGRVHPEALALLEARGHPTADLRSKSWDEFLAADTPPDLVITVCGNADQACPMFPGQPLRAHWGLPDPAAAPEAEQPAAFARTYARLAARAEAFLALPFETLSRSDLTAHLARIGALD